MLRALKVFCGRYYHVRRALKARVTKYMLRAGVQSTNTLNINLSS